MTKKTPTLAETVAATLPAIDVERVLSVALVVPLGRDVNDPACPWGLPVCLEGHPGIGKSERIEEVGRRVGLEKVVTILTPTTSPEDYTGVRLPNGKGSTEFASLMPQIDELVAAKSGILFLDELSSASPTVQAAGLGVVLNGRIAGKTLSPRVRRIAAMNPLSSAAAGVGLEAPMANRFCHLKAPTPRVGEWFDWVMSSAGSINEGQLEVSEELVKKNWGPNWDATVSVARGFMQGKGDEALFQMPAEGHDDRGHAWASPRTWFFALRAMATCRALGADDETLGALLAGCVGDGLAGEFLSYTRKLDLPSPREVLDGKWKPSPSRLDVSVAAYTQATMYVINGKRVEDLPKLWTRFKAFLDTGGADLLLPLVKRAVQAYEKETDSIVEAMAVLTALSRGGMNNYLRNIKV